jgi:hypothetical protein
LFDVKQKRSGLLPDPGLAEQIALAEVDMEIEDVE